MTRFNNSRNKRRFTNNQNKFKRSNKPFLSRKKRKLTLLSNQNKLDQSHFIKSKKFVKKKTKAERCWRTLSTWLLDPNALVLGKGNIFNYNIIVRPDGPTNNLSDNLLYVIKKMQGTVSLYNKTNTTWIVDVLFWRTTRLFNNQDYFVTPIANAFQTILQEEQRVLYHERRVLLGGKINNINLSLRLHKPIVGTGRQIKAQENFTLTFRVYDITNVNNALPQNPNVIPPNTPTVGIFTFADIGYILKTMK